MMQEYSLVIADSLMYPGKSYREREHYRRDLHWLINKKFPGYAARKFGSSSEAAMLARQIQLHFNVAFDIVREMDVR